MKKPSKKYTLFIILSLIFFITTWSLKAIYFKDDIKYIAKSTKESNIEENNNEKDYIIGISHTLSEAITYLEKNINDKNRKEDINRIIQDSLDGLIAIENFLYSKNRNFNSILNETKNLKKDFEKLKIDINNPLNTQKIIKDINNKFRVWKKNINNLEGD